MLGDGKIREQYVKFLYCHVNLKNVKKLIHQKDLFLVSAQFCTHFNSTYNNLGAFAEV